MDEEVNNFSLKICNKCNSLKPIGEFHRDRAKKDGRYTLCKLCKRGYKLKYYKDNTEKMLDRSRKYYKDNTEKMLDRSRKYYKDNTESELRRNKVYRESNPEKYLARSRSRRAALSNAKCKNAIIDPSNTASFEESNALIEENERLIKQFYAEAKRLTAETGVLHVVDHIYPIQK